MHIIPSIYDVSVYQDSSLEEITEIIRTKFLDEVIKISQTKNKAERNALKIQLPAFTLAEFSGGRITKENFVETKYLIFDIDSLPSKSEADTAASAFRDIALFVFKTPSLRGIKFVIEMDRPITKEIYDGNWKFYYQYFSETYNRWKLDNAYRSFHTFFSHDGGCKLNPKRKLYPVYDLYTIKETRDINPDTINPGEVADVCEFLSNSHPLNYTEWMSCALALKTIVDQDQALELFLLIGSKDDTPDHKHRDWAGKYRTVGEPKDITIASLFWIAQQRGYKRKRAFSENGQGRYSPFGKKDEGLYYKGKLMFGFSDIEIKYTIIDSGGNKTMLSIDGYDFIVPTTALNSPGEFSKEIMRSVPRFTYMAMTKDAPAYDALFRYLAMMRSPDIVTKLPGLGEVKKGIWNLGNAVIVNGSIFPFSEIVYTHEHTGFMLDQSDQLNVQSSTKFWERMASLFDFYDEWAAVAIGWAFANIFFEEIIKNMMGFPMLFIHGRTRSGKSQLAHLILSMFGVKNPENDADFKLNMDKASKKAMERVKDRSAGIPHMFDEYGGGTNMRRRDEHFLVLKSMYDASGSTRAVFSNDNRVHKMHIRSGSIFTSCSKPTEEEAINRCVFVNLDGLSDSKDSMAYENELGGDQRNDLSSFIIIASMRATWPMYMKHYNVAIKNVYNYTANNRVAKNYALVLAGWELFLEIVGDKVDPPEISKEWWVNNILKAQEYIDDQNIAQVFVMSLYYQYGQLAEHQRGWMSIGAKDVTFEGGIQSVTALSFSWEQAYLHFKKTYPLEIVPSKSELRKRLMEIPTFVENTTMYFPNGRSSYGYTFLIEPPTHILHDNIARLNKRKAEKALPEPSPQDEIPF